MRVLMKYQVDVDVRSQYIADESDAKSSRYVFAYTVNITNTGDTPAKLISRHWIITDATGSVQEVKGLGVVGEQPHLKPGESFEYTSGTVMETPVGSMEGTYQMLADDQTEFEAQIPAFSLSAPHALH